MIGIQAVRPRLQLYKTFDEAAVAVDEMFNTAFQNAGRKWIVFYSSNTVLTKLLSDSGG